VNLQSMQNDYLKRLAALRRKYGLADGERPAFGTTAAYQFAQDEDALYSAEYDARYQALLAAKGGTVDRQTKLLLTDQARQSFGMQSTASAPIPTKSTAGAWWDQITGQDSPFTATSFGDFWGRAIAGTADVPTETVSAAVKSTSSAFALLLAGVIVYAVAGRK
jgi:hypothetical protein